MPSTDDFLPIPVPESLTATYLVPVSTPPPVTPAQAVAALADRLGGPVHDLVRQMLDGPLMTIDIQPAAHFPRLPPDLLAAFGATPAQLTRLEVATDLVVVQASFRPGWPPAHEWAARAVAAALAASVGGDVIDVFGLQFLDPARALRSLSDTDGRIRLVEWVLVPYSSDDDVLWFTTKGLRRFGLLELQAQRVPPELARPWGAVMTGAARRLLRTWIEGLADTELPAFVQLPVQVPVTGDDIAQAYGKPQPDTASPAVLRMELDPATDPDAESFLTLLPPAGYSGPPERHFAAACTALSNAAPPLPRQDPASEAMARAVETARTGLPGIRQRFLAGGLPPGTQLVVKYGLPTDDAREFVWASVTSWPTPGRIQAASASDAVSDPAVRVGRPVVVDTADVVDWALLDERGVVEGGWTQAVLDGRRDGHTPGAAP